MSNASSTNRRPVRTNHIPEVIPLLIKEGSGVVVRYVPEVGPSFAEEGVLGRPAQGRDLKAAQPTNGDGLREKIQK